MKKCLIGFIMMIALIIPISNIKALEFTYPRNDVVVNEEWIYNTVYVENNISFEDYPYVYLRYFTGSTNYNPSMMFYIYHKDETAINKLYASTDSEYDLGSVRLSKPFYQVQINTNGIGTFHVNEYSGSYGIQQYYKTTEYLGGYQYYYTNFDIIDVNTGEILKSADIDFSVLNEKKPDLDINIYYNEDIELQIPQAEIELSFENFNTFYKYEYSFNGKDYFDIPLTDVIDNKYTLYAYQNGSIYTRILNLSGEVLVEKTALINQIIDTEKIYYYEIPLSDFYDNETGKLKYHYFFYTKENNDIPYFGFSFKGDTTNELPFAIIHKDNIIDKNSFLNKLSFEDVYSTPLPYDYIDTEIYSNNYLSSSAFIIVPCIDLETNSFSEYTGESIVIKSNLELNIGKPIMIDGVLRPSSSNLNDDATEISGAILRLLNPILKKFPIIDQIQELYDLYSYDYGEGELPVFTVDLSFLGVEKVVEIIDFQFFLEYRDYFFAFEKIFLGFYTFIGVIKKAKASLGGG